ncbi:hypothetical protein PHMEG_00029162 [Phytophthora megakarya]|uniref:Uncharacterized protein n=1 Tax=Phytophthora megakarya TaxID=4795 RepID=A0A225V5S8_9STRA|nr:hypothetical protein PHMEG_00029162 [Phytophthora megakarya]
MPSSVLLKVLRSSAYAEAPRRSSVDSCTPVSGSRCSAKSSGLMAALKSCGLSGQPWNTPTRRESQRSANGTLPNALRKSYQTSKRVRRLRRAWSTSVAARKLCSPQPLTARKPFCPGAWRSLASSHRPSRRARTPL